MTPLSEFLTGPKNPMVNQRRIQKALKTVCNEFDSVQRKRRQERQMRSWNKLGVVETIYKEECDFSTMSSPTLSPYFPSSPASLNSRVEAWSLKTGRETDILVRIQGTCFRLHKDRMVSQSTFLKRHLTETSDLTLSPPLNITPETFAIVAEFCYGFRLHMTPANVSAIRTAAELLGMTAADGGDSLSHVAETYFRRVVGINREYASMVLRSCLPLLPDAETTASLVSRCIEALVSEDDSYGDICVSRLDDVVRMKPGDFQTLVESMNIRFRNHDVLYKMVDLYLKENNSDKLTDEQKTQICNSIDCTKLSIETLVDCVQNPRMPLRLVVRAVLLEHLNTRHSIASTIHDKVQFKSHNERQRCSIEQQHTSLTLGDILKRDTAIHQTAQLKAALDTTNTRIQSLEKELKSMNRILLKNQAEEEEKRNSVLGSERSASFHYASLESGRVEKGERGSFSSSSIRFDGRRMENYEVERASFSADCGNGKPKMNKNFRQRLMTGLKNAFRGPNFISN